LGRPRRDRGQRRTVRGSVLVLGRVASGGGCGRGDAAGAAQHHEPQLRHFMTPSTYPVVVG